MPLQQRDLPLMINVSLKCLSKSAAKRLFKMLFEKRWRLDRLKTLINEISARSLTLLKCVVDHNPDMSQ